MEPVEGKSTIYTVAEIEGKPTFSHVEHRTFYVISERVILRLRTQKQTQLKQMKASMHQLVNCLLKGE